MLSALLLCLGGAHPDYKLPADWPVRALTLPAAADIVEMPWCKHRTETAVDREWIVVFQCDGPPAAVADHIEACLRPLSYKRFMRDTRQADASSCVYFSTDGVTRVQLRRRADGNYALQLEHNGAPHRDLHFANLGGRGAAGLLGAID